MQTHTTDQNTSETTEKSKDSSTINTFWHQADTLQNESIRHARALFPFMQTANHNALTLILTQYRFFVAYYISDLATLISLVQHGDLRSFLAEVLWEELGEGNSAKAHPVLYDLFLESLGVPSPALAEKALTDNINLLEKSCDALKDPLNGEAYGIGLRGMGGECVCQIYLTELYEQMLKNPFIQQNKHLIHWQFWDIHVGEQDIIHRKKTRQLIYSEMLSWPDDKINTLSRGYNDSMRSWRKFWETIFQAAQDVTN